MSMKPTASVATPAVAPAMRASAAGSSHPTNNGHHASLIQLDVSADDDRLNSGFESSTGRLPVHAGKMGGSASTNYYCRPGVSQSTAPGGGRSVSSLQGSTNANPHGGGGVSLTMPPPAPTAACIGRAPPSPRSRGGEDVSFLFNWLAEQQGDSYDAAAPMVLPPPMSAVLLARGAVTAPPVKKATSMPVVDAATAKAGNPFR